MLDIRSLVRDAGRLNIKSRWTTLFLGVALSLGVDAARAQESFKAVAVQEFKYDGAPALRLPTAVAVAGDGTVFVADGVNDRILQFAAGGKFLGEIREVAGQQLSQPISVKIGVSGGLWIADTGNGRALLRGPNGALLEIVEPGRNDDGQSLDVTDVLPTADGKTLWLVDNDHHRLAKFDLARKKATYVGGRGEGLGQFHFPFMLAAGRSGEIFVTDVINGRVLSVDGSGKTTRKLGGYGVDLGQLYRPKGIACDAAGNVWVADGTMGVIQVFRPTGELIDVLRRDDGKPFHFEMPAGITFDTSGNLYVAEVGADRARKLKITHDPKATAKNIAAAPERKGGQPPTCTVCHIEWIAPFDHGESSELMEAPLSVPERPFASRSETCLSCHDGSVVDSRRRVWQEHGHLTGVTPLKSMKVPPHLPLVDGEIDCRTCHSAHATGEPEGDLKTAVFLRMRNEAGELCISCHGDKTRGPELGTHPIGGMPWLIPTTLIEAGAKVGPNPRELTCMVCHTPHGSREEHLLVMGTESNQLCLNCHQKLRPSMWRADLALEHPQRPPLSTAAQRDAITTMGTKTGPNETLICLSCHKLHHGQAGRYMLAETLEDSRLCLQCHPDKDAVLGGAHDLRTSAPLERNLIGQTPQQSGPCGACHSFHRFTRAPKTAPGDETGFCASCHSAGECAESASGFPMAHAATPDCLACHDPHESKRAHFVRGESTETVCLECHEIGDGLDHSMHGATFLKEAFALSKPSATAQTCGPCHAVHPSAGAAHTGMWSGPLGSPEHSVDVRRCLGCHGAGGPAVPARVVRHPVVSLSNIADEDSDGYLPLVDDKGNISKQGRIACITCHLPHGPGEEDDLFDTVIETSGRAQLRALKPMLRAYVAPNLCGTCHGFEGLSRFLYFHDWRDSRGDLAPKAAR